MSGFQQLLQRRLDAGGFSTEDVLISFLPLVRETLQAHMSGLVAPLVGLEHLRVDGPRIWFPESACYPPRQQTAEIRRLEDFFQSPVEIVRQLERSTEVGSDQQQVVNLAIASVDQPLTQPAYLPGHICWEHTVGHQDPLTDVFSLGLILASLACALDLSQPADLETFVQHRENLFAVAPSLHPVLAQVIVRMTQLDRHRRAQDLQAILAALEDYREQRVDFQFDLARLPGLQQRDTRTRQQLILEKLRERLFEVSRRNRLLHFQPTMQTVNLTQASIPLAFDITNIRPDQILIWNDALQHAIGGGSPLSLNKYLNFNEALYLPSVLERIMADARRDEAEFGFAQLRLVICFLHWANLKEQPIQKYTSPLLLLPVKLKKKKGIRDTFLLELDSTVAELNPVVRHLFQQLYDIALPETLDVAASSVRDFYDYLSARIHASQPAVSCDLIDRPRIALLRDKARRRLDQYQRRARLAGRGVRTYLNLDYSYDAANYHPLGLKLFTVHVRTPSSRLREIIERQPRPRSFMVAPQPQTGAEFVEQEQTFYELEGGASESPYAWSFDLCNVTLANFHYRKMSLVRDYDTLLANPANNAAFEAAFSLTPRPVQQWPTGSSHWEERFDVVPCDPTQAAAVARARHGQSFIIQGPPGTGKSQTICNLIADYVAQSKRVLFVCEKRAAIDVVYARLRQCGLADLCCLIHDSQTDKRSFVMDLKQTYEQLLRTNADGSLAETMSPGSLDRSQALHRLEKELAPLERFAAVMNRQPERAGVTLRELLRRGIALSDHLPSLNGWQQERLPRYEEWIAHEQQIERFTDAVAHVQPDGILAHHPLHALSPRLTHVEHPLETVSAAVSGATEHLKQLAERLADSSVPAHLYRNLAEVAQLVAYAEQVGLVAEAGKLAVLDRQSPEHTEFHQARRSMENKLARLRAAQDAASGWREPLSIVELRIALQQTRQFAQSWLAWLHPAWWRLRRVLNRCYDFSRHAVRPSWTDVLTLLEQQFEAASQLQEQQAELAERFHIQGDVETFCERVAEIDQQQSQWSESIRSLHTQLLVDSAAGECIRPLVDAHHQWRLVQAHLQQITDCYEDWSVETALQQVAGIQQSLAELPDFLSCIAQLDGAPAALCTALQRLDHSPRSIEAAVISREIDLCLRADPALAKFTAMTRDRHAQRLESGYDRWLDSNAQHIRQVICARFQQHVGISQAPAAQLDQQQREFKKVYSRGRRDLEHEFGKSMRYKSIRDLVSGESGQVIKDLKPIWLMSPLSVSDTLPLDYEHFDVVIFDEASQITLEEAIPPLFRAQQTIVVGDQMQLPPTNFFAVKRSEEDEELWVEENGEEVRYDLESDSFLNQAAKNLSSIMLGWHYRSRSESLISFSNWTFYDGRLLTVPEERLSRADRQPLRASATRDAERNAAALVERPISFHLLEHGVYDKRRNRAEAEYIAALVAEILEREDGVTLGIVAFSEAQQSEIEAALNDLAARDATFRQRLAHELEREEDGQFVGLLVKNLENIQGDERDVIILSVCYGRGPNGRMLMNFGPINKSGGEKRLNVAFSRAKRHMAVVSSIQHSDITNEYNDGANCLKNYLRYCEALSCGDQDAAQDVLRLANRRSQHHAQKKVEIVDPVVGQLAEALRARGWHVDCSVGQSHFRCDLAVCKPGDSAYRLAILIDGDAYYRMPDALERDMQRPRLLRAFGWRVAFVLAKQWHQDAAAVLQRLCEMLDDP